MTNCMCQCNLKKQRFPELKISITNLDFMAAVNTLPTNSVKRSSNAMIDGSVESATALTSIDHDCEGRDSDSSRATADSNRCINFSSIGFSL
ncbi:hypothetical protein HanHA300_Chr10g0378681 [Helianthus annuus]|nr:hypothetical protein HanHA300_Chr10g0378681 [Helianthus annuus]KAJ0531449.1 hypothetical protein HanHA89_Chr10g0401231 [Helianthus annuus]KAJ0698292.1 hypothetical protein HanLR1_Chr10g0378471 [Helianthus annuus]KAJ0701659.1 hypothetical protein HanOQP8_Chr10g0381801 [Helianthus annuus]